MSRDEYDRRADELSRDDDLARAMFDEWIDQQPEEEDE
jgi:hypothetical protein